MDQKHHITIVGVKNIDYRNKRTGAPGQLRLAQCIVTSHDEEKGEQTVVGELMLPSQLHDAIKGQYLAEFELSVGQDLRIGARLTKLHPVAPVAPAARPSPAQAAVKSGAPT